MQAEWVYNVGIGSSAFQGGKLDHGFRCQALEAKGFCIIACCLGSDTVEAFPLHPGHSKSWKSRYVVEHSRLESRPCSVSLQKLPL